MTTITPFAFAGESAGIGEAHIYVVGFNGADADDGRSLIKVGMTASPTRRIRQHLATARNILRVDMSEVAIWVSPPHAYAAENERWLIKHVAFLRDEDPRNEYFDAHFLDTVSSASALPMPRASQAHRDLHRLRGERGLLFARSVAAGIFA